MRRFFFAKIDSKTINNFKSPPGHSYTMAGTIISVLFFAGRKNSIRCHLILRASYFYIFYPYSRNNFHFSHSLTLAAAVIFLSSNEKNNNKTKWKKNQRKERKENYTGYCSITISIHTEKKEKSKMPFYRCYTTIAKIRSKHSAQIKIIISTSNVITWKLLGHYWCRL